MNDAPMRSHVGHKWFHTTEIPFLLSVLWSPGPSSKAAHCTNSMATTNARPATTSNNQKRRHQQQEQQQQQPQQQQQEEQQNPQIVWCNDLIRLSYQYMEWHELMEWIEMELNTRNQVHNTKLVRLCIKGSPGFSHHHRGTVKGMPWTHLNLPNRYVHSPQMPPVWKSKER